MDKKVERYRQIIIALLKEDASDTDLVGELESRGVAQNDIVLAFHKPVNRSFMDFAVA